ncbi:thyrostimulin beta-5 subunit [Cloeon dipterum]|uniref:thyrostimulin beta-5 subunit n=1 Tax=Cloeon dipterum TaxID=197152 RepID=UPI00322070FD
MSATVLFGLLLLLATQGRAQIELNPILADMAQIDMSNTLGCHRRLYSYKVIQSDPAGRSCWDVVNVMSCWGRCDSNEISDWRFPYKRSFHPVCMHDDRRPMSVELKNCDADTLPGTERYVYYEAVSCRCSVCKSSEASCEGLRYRGQRSGNKH